MTLVEGDPKAPFLIATTGVGEGGTPFPGILPFTLDLHLIVLGAKQGGIKYHFLSFWIKPGVPDHWRTLNSLGQWLK